MGLFSWLGDAATTVCKFAGIEFSPSGIVQGVSKLAGMISEAVPVVGPIISHTLPALGSIFGSTEREHSSEQNRDLEISKFLAKQEDVINLIISVETEIKNSHKAIKDDLEEVKEHVDVAILKNEVSTFREAVDAVIHYFKTEATNLQRLTPKKDAFDFQTFVTANASPTLLTNIRNDLVKQQGILEGRLNDMIQSDEFYLTGRLLEAYVMTTSWLLMCDKSLLHLLGYLARIYIVGSDVPNYISTMNTWNTTFNSMRQHTLSGIKFLLGADVTTSSNFSKDTPGFLLKLRGKRESSIQTDDTKITDNWHRTAFGFAGRGGKAANTQPLIMEAGSITPELFKATCIPLYKDTNMRYFDLCAQSYIEVAEKWQDALVKWDSRLPVSPANGKQHAVPTQTIIHSKDENRKQAGNLVQSVGYSQKTTIQYAISYVGAQGEGFLSEWSESLSPTVDGACFKVTLQPVTLSVDPYAEWEPVRKNAGNRAKSGNIGEAAPITRRVYVKYKVDDEVTKYAWLADVLDDQLTELVDGGVGTHGIMYTARTPHVDVTDEKVDEKIRSPGNKVNE